MTDPNPPAQSSTGRLMRVLLAVSLAVNLLVFGAIGTAYFTWGHGAHPHNARGIGGPLTRALDREDRRAIGREMRRAFRAGGHGGARKRPDFKALIADLRASPFDPDKVEARLTLHRAILGERMEMGQRLLLERLAGMSDAERADFADRVESHLEKRRGHHKVTR